MEFFAELTKLIKLSANYLHLIMMHPSEHLDHHGHGLLKLIEHLLLHQAELIDQGRQHRCGQLRLSQVGRKRDIGGCHLDLVGKRGDSLD
jgi:hypothetical protein